MRLTQFADVHPDWDIVRSFDTIETKTVLELLVTTMLLDGRITRSERETLIDEFARLPVGSATVDSETVKHMIRTTRGRMEEIRRKPEKFGPYLDRMCSAITDRGKAIATMRLVAMMAMSDGARESEIDFCRAVGSRLRLTEDTVEDIIRATWESRQRYVSDRVPGIDRNVKPVRGARRFEEHNMSPHNLPFSQDETGE